MPVYEIQAPDGRTFEVEGNRPPTEQEIRQMLDAVTVKKQRTAGEVIGGVFDAAATAATSAIAQPVAGLVGLANLAAYQDPESAARRVEQVQNRLTYAPSEAGAEYLQNVANLPVIKDIGETMTKGAQQLGDLTLDVTGSPAAAAVAQAAPEAFAAYLGAKAPTGTSARLEARKKVVDKNTAAMQLQDAETMNVSEIGKPLGKSIKKPTYENFRSMAEVIDADPKFYEALEKLGVTQQPLASYASQNPQFRGLEQSFAAIPNSPQNAQSIAFLKDVSNVAHALDKKYTEATGSVDASITWREAALKNIDQLGNAAQEAYDMLDEVVDKRAPVVAPNTNELIQESVKNLAAGIDDPDVHPVIKSIVKSISPRTIKTEAGEMQVPATYENLDQLRKRIGAAAFNGEGEFKDAEKGVLKRAYSALTDDLNAMAEAQGLANEVQGAKTLVAQRKRLEEQMQNLIGDKLQKDIVPVIQKGVEGLAKGGAQRYKQIMSNIPDEKVRQELVYTAIADTFRQTMKGEKDQFNATKYLTWYNDTLGNPTVRKLMESDLPKGVMDDFDNLAKVSQGMARATSQRIPTGVINAVLNDNLGFVHRLLGRGAAIGATAVGAGAIAADTSAMIISLAEKGTDRARAASDLLADPRLQRIIASGYAQGRRSARINKEIEASLKKSARYKKWIDTLNANEKRQIEALGITQFLTAPEDEQPLQ